MASRYLLCPGYVQSKVDGDWHYISADALARLYNVDLKDCEVLYTFGTPFHRRQAKRVQAGELIPLQVDYHGGYKIPQEKTCATPSLQDF